MNALGTVLAGILLGAVLMLPHATRAERAEKLAGPWSPTIWYFLDRERGVRNGGRNPLADDCATHWKDGNGKEWATADCVGFAIWCMGAKRKLSTFAEYHGSINTDSMLLDAAHTRSHFDRVTMPFRGCLIVMPGVMKDGKRVKPGHVGVVVEVDPAFDPAHPRLELVRVAHCSPSHHKTHGQAVAITDARVFGSRAYRFLDFHP